MLVIGPPLRLPGSPLTNFQGNDSKDMDYLNSLISKWMPESSPRVAVDSHPRLSGIMDTVNSTLAHGPKTRLPSAFYDTKGREIIDKIGSEEWFSGYKESQEYRKVGIGALVGDIVTRMVGNVDRSGNDGLREVAGVDGDLGKGRGGESGIKFTMSGCHDTTLAAILSSLGAFEGEEWPPYTSHIAVELFKDESVKTDSATPAEPAPRQPFMGSSRKKTKPASLMMRKPTQELTAEEKAKLRGQYVRLRYNDRPVTIPGCQLPGNHMNGDETFCTLVCEAECPNQCMSLTFDSKPSKPSRTSSLLEFGLTPAPNVWVNRRFPFLLNSLVSEGACMYISNVGQF